jgi:phage-related tail protein
MSTQTRSEVIDNVATLNEQFRKITEATTEQTRQTLHAAQEQWQQNLTRAQQAQSDFAPMMVRLNEQNAQLVTAAFNSLWDYWTSVGKLAAWGEEQTERFVAQMMEQGKRIREEGTALLRDTAEHVRQDQAELYRLAQESLRVGSFYAGKTIRREGEAAR